MFYLVRPTVIQNLRRAGFKPSDIMKLSGHSSVDTIVKNYDHTLDDGQKVNMAAAICFAPQLKRGDVSKIEGKHNKYTVFLYIYYIY